MDNLRAVDYDFEMRVYEVILSSGAKADVTAEILHDDPGRDDKIYFYRDKTHKHLVAYFLREAVSGIIFGPDNPSNMSGRPKIG